MRLKFLLLGGSFLLASCATGAGLISDIEEAPRWFKDQIEDAEQLGYPATATTPDKPDDIPSLSEFDQKLESLKKEGARIKLTEQALSESMNTDTAEFAREAHERTDIEKFYAEQDALLAEDE